MRLGDHLRGSFAAGAVLGIVLGGTALWLTDTRAALPALPTNAPLLQWVDVNLGFSVWLFAIVLALYGLNLSRLHRVLEYRPVPQEAVELDQLSDVWIHLFVGIGVIWTAVGMRSALQAALSNPGDALTDTAGNVLRDLVDGGILLALTTTIVGAIGGYLMRLGKTMLVGAALQRYYDSQHTQPMQVLIKAAERIESRLPNQRSEQHAS
ncbi:MAG: hypothetical protein AB8B93_20085 [Pseudomonadales bacterium]